MLWEAGNHLLCRIPLLSARMNQSFPQEKTLAENS